MKKFAKIGLLSLTCSSALLSAPGVLIACQEFDSHLSDTDELYSYNPDGTVDTTSGWGAFLDIGFTHGTLNLDLGGGRSDRNSELLLEKFGVINLVIDPFNRSKDHNKSTLGLVEQSGADTITSFSVLNVIKEKRERLRHITLAHRLLKPGGLAYFKIWPGDNSGIAYENRQTGVYQSNCTRECYFEEISSAFGPENTQLGSVHHLIMARKINAPSAQISLP